MIEKFRSQLVNFFPLQPKSKIPMVAWKQYQSERYTGVIPPSCNFAIVCGNVSANLAVFDFDHCEDLDVLNAVIPNALENTLVVKSQRGFHVYLKLDRTIKNVKLTRNDNMFIDVQSDGKYVVAPTSIHPSGITYEVISKTCDIKKAFGEDVLKSLQEVGFEVELGGTEGISGAEIAKGGIKNGSLHDSLRTYALHLILKADITNRDTYDYELNRWNREGNNEYKVNDQDFRRTIDDAWNYGVGIKNKEASPEGGDSKKKDSGTHSEFAVRIMREMPIKTMRDTDEMLFYKDGVYNMGAESRVAEMCQNLVPDCKSSDVYEISNTIRRLTYVDREDFDKDPMKINLLNGVVDVMTGEVSDHSPDKLYRNCVPVTYDPKILPVEVPKFLLECHLGDGDTYLELLEQASYILYREPTYQLAFMYTGIGSNGKSVWLDWLQNFFGRQNCANQSLHDFVTNRFAPAELEGKLLNIYPDLKPDALKQNDKLKPLIAGDAMTVERKNQHPFIMRPYAKMFFSANQVPEVYDTSDAMYRRLSLTRWERVFTEKTRDVNKARKIGTEGEKSGMLNLMLMTLRKMLKRGGFTRTQTVAQRREAWVVESNPIIDFVDRYVAVKDNTSVLCNELWSKFNETTDKVVKNQREFESKVMILTGCQKSRSTSGLRERMFVGITLRATLRAAGQQSL